MKKEGRRHNSVLPQLAVTCEIGTECSNQTFVQVDNEVLRNRQLRQHANRYVQPIGGLQTSNDRAINELKNSTN